MRYVLAVLSHGEPDSPHVERTLRSFRANVTPDASSVIRFHDTDRLGFCRATASLWGLAVEEAVAVDADHVFWLEHDFVFRRPVELELLAAILKPNPDIGPVAQVSLMRNAVNAVERAAGGLFESRPGEYRPRRLRAQENPVHGQDEPFLTHSSYFTTNPSLMTVRFMVEHPFAAGASRQPYDIECEGRYGQDLIRDGYQFAVMGHGEPWVEHIGVRTGEGY